jgi:hypothetical protein
MSAPSPTKEAAVAPTTPAQAAAEAVPETPRAHADPNVDTLKAAFPDIDEAVISAVLMASGHNLERSFDALLGMSDPTHKPDVPSKGSAPALSAEQQRQIEADEELARQIRLEDRAYQKFAQTQRQRQQGSTPQEPERSFLDDELPVIKETIMQGFNETKTKVSGFLSSLKDQYTAHMQESTAPASSAAPRTSVDRIKRGEPDRARASLAYEADPDAVAVLDEDFNELELHDSTTPSKPIKPVKLNNSQDAIKARAQSASKWEKIEPQQKEKPLADQDQFDIGSDD